MSEQSGILYKSLEKKNKNKIERLYIYLAKQLDVYLVEQNFVILF